MKRITILMLALVVACGVLSAPNAGAGWFEKKKPQRTEKPEWMTQPQRYEGPRMSFHSGILQQDGWTGWRLGETKIQFTKDCLITTEGASEGFLDAGREAIVMGPKFGDTILAWSVRVAQPEFMVGRNQSSEMRLETSETNPDCGKILEAPH